MSMIEPATTVRRGGRGRMVDDTFRWLVTGAGATVLVILAWMIGSTTLESWPVFAKEGINFFTSTVWAPGPSPATTERWPSSGAR
jgi:phosphate transport system permease protein